MYTYYRTEVKKEKTMAITEARRRIFELAEDVQKDSTYYTLTEKGKPKAVLMSAEEFESLIETLEVMHEFPNLREDIKEAEEDYKLGRTISLEELLAEEKINVSSNPLKKSKKGTKKNSKKN